VREGKITRKKRTRASGFKAKYNRGIMVINTIALSMAKEIESSSIAGANKACSNGRNRENK